jgi:regulator of protease activity HflC (stomatin/prohibitin superfamily)
MNEIIGLIVLLPLILLFVLLNTRVLKAGYQIVVERLGAFHRIIDQPGIHFFIPFVDRPIETIKMGILSRSMKVQTTLDDYTYQYEVIDPKLYVYAYPNPLIQMDELIFSYSLTITDELLNEIEKMGIKLIDIRIDN